MTKKIYMSDEDKMMRDKSLTWAKPAIVTSKDYLKAQFEKLKTTKYGFSIKIFDGEGNSTNQMELTPNRVDELKEMFDESELLQLQQ
tara:strand:- start:37 stop:297 length:261 start_codon:yes stop_codon:yes gene_type:complete